MSNSNLQELLASTYLSSGNMTYVDSLYADYLIDPNKVTQDWRQIFNSLQATQAPQSFDHKQYRVAKLINEYRLHGHHAAKLDPLEMTARLVVPSLELNYHQLESADLDRYFFAGKYFNPGLISLKEIYQALRQTYCGSIGIEYMHISNNEETEWLQEKMESVRSDPAMSTNMQLTILKHLIAADGLERYLGTRYVGQKRFSLEGGDSLIPLLQELINQADTYNVKEILIGMAHRGRLNVLVNVLGKEPDQLFQEFEGKINPTGEDLTGDVKYHMGFASDVLTKSGKIMHLTLAFNPSHLEIIGPVIEGAARSRLRYYNNLEQKNLVLPVIIHGDAAFAGQGVVMETFNFSQARGYSTGGTIHIVINNQIGFTTSDPLDARSTLYCTDVAKMVQAPIIHVNGDDPEAVIFVIQVAFEFKMRFQRDVVIDLVCYRRHGHNEADEPSITQPLMYSKIKALRSIKDIYADKLINLGIIDSDQVHALMEEYRNLLDKGKSVVKTVTAEQDSSLINNWNLYLHGKWNDPAQTKVTLDAIQRLDKKLHQLPTNFNCHPVVKRLLDERSKMAAGELPINWGYAETMAYATLLEEGYEIRLSGQDSGRGTFAHRHAILHDMQTGEIYIPLEKISMRPIPIDAHALNATATLTKKPFVVIDSVLSEEAVLAFEYGYASSEPNTLVIWEAQFGDFANGAQVVIDQFISSGEQKWGRLCGLILFLPHGYEGQGPEHSSARLERYLQLCAQHNIQVCVPTTPAQIFHLLRRQLLRHFRKPLIVMTPKSLLRHKLAVSSIEELTTGKFINIIDEIDNLPSAAISKIVLCSGKVYYDLLVERRKQKLDHIAIIRIEQLYPFPNNDFKKIMAKFAHVKKIIWCQEEPQNQGAWFATKHHIESCLLQDQEINYSGREFAAAPAVGNPILHAKQQQALVLQALQ